MANAESEKILLGSWLLGHNREHVKEFSGEDFSYHRQTFRAIERSWEEKRKIDPVEVSGKAGVSVAETMEMTSLYQPSFYDGAYRQVKSHRLKRLLKQIGSESDIEEAVKRLVSEVDKLDVESIEQPPDFIQNFIDEMDRRAKQEPLKFGMGILDKVTGGIRPQELTTLAARPAVGKSAMALQIALNAVKQGKKALFFSAEMNDIQIAERLFCRESEVSQRSLKRGMVNEDKQAGRAEWKKFNECLGRLEKIKPNLILQVRTRSLSRMKRAIKHYKPDLVIIDQLSLLTEDRGFKNIRERFSYMTVNLKAIAMDLNLPIILLAQINRDAQEEIPTLANLKESGSIEEDSDNVILLHRLTEKQAEKSERYLNNYDELMQQGRYPTLMKVEKQRNGQTGGIYALYEGQKFKFSEMERSELGR